MRLSLLSLFLVSLTVAIADPGTRVARSPYHRSRIHHTSHTIHHPHTTVHQPHTYPSSSGKSGNSYGGSVHHVVHHTTTTHYTPRRVYHHYHYNPPLHIRYGSYNHPVYQGDPPIYVYEYRNSGSRFDNLLTGLALYNLGRNSNSRNYDPNRQYSSVPGEECKLRISKGPVDFEETRIDCNLMSSFIWEPAQNTTQIQQPVMLNPTQVTVTQFVNATGNYSVSTVTTTNNTVQDALNVKGPSIQVTPFMNCSLIKTFRNTITLHKTVDCGLLQQYAQSSLERSVAKCLTPLKRIIFNFLIIYLPSNILRAN